MTDQRIRILIVDDHPMVLKGLAATLNPEPDMEVVAAATDGEQAVKLFRDERPDITIMDLNLKSNMTGTQAIQAIRHEFPEARIIVLTVNRGDDDIFRALRAGAVTYLLKETLGDDLVSIIRDVHAGGGPIPPQVARKLADRVGQPSLTSREMEVLKLMAKGLRNKQIAGQLGISDQTAQGHVKSVLLKLNVHDRTEAVTAAFRRGIIHIETI